MGLVLRDLSLRIAENVIFKSLDLILNPKEIHVLLGPNGIGKSSLLKAVAGHTHYTPSGGQICINNEDISQCGPDVRAQKGIFVAFQNPSEIEGLSVANFLRTTLKAYPQNAAYHWSTTEFYQHLYHLLEQVGLPKTFTSRSVNCGFSGGEKKRFELLQLLLFKPKFALLDELDSGLDIDAKKLVAATIAQLQAKEDMSFLIVSHDIEFIRSLNPTHLHVFKEHQLIPVDISTLNQIETQGFCKL